MATGKNKSKRVSAPALKRVLDQLRSAPGFLCVLRFSTAWYKPYQQLCSVNTSISVIHSKYDTGDGSTNVDSDPPKKINVKKKK